MEYRAGTRLRSAVCNTEVVIVKPPSAGIVQCGGSPMLAPGDTAPAGASISPDASEGTVLGKRYVDEASGIEALCTKPGDGSLALDDTPLTIQDAKPLPASD